MYKRRKRRGSNKTKGKRKDLSNPQDQDLSFSEEVESSFEEKREPILATPAEIIKIGMMSVTTMEQNVAGDQGKAVGARKRKPTQNRISKIVENSQQELDQDQQDYYNSSGPGSGHESAGLIISSSVNNNNSPPYKKPCLEGNKNGMIKNILSELKTAKQVSGNYQMPSQLGRGDSARNSVNNSDEGDIDEDDEDEGGELRIHEDERIEVEGNEMTKISKKVKNLSPLRSRRRSSRNNNNNENGAGWSDDGVEDDENEMMMSANDEGVDHIGSGGADDKEGLPFRCGVCVYGSCDKSTLLRHMRTHSGERPFQCRLCYFAFTTKANCERHLKNRHGQIDRQQMRNLVVCYPSSSESENESSTIKKEKKESNANNISNGKVSTPPPLISIVPSHSIMSIVGSSATDHQEQEQPLSLRKVDQHQQNNNISIVEQHQQRRRESIGSIGGDDAPLDLSMDAVDLSTKMKESSFKRRSLFAPRPMYPTPEISNLLVTSPFISKRQPMSHPGQLPLGTFGSHTLGQGGGVGPGFSSLFPFSGPGGFNPFTMLPQANVEKLINLGAGGNSPPKVHNSFLTSSSPNFGSPHPHESLLMNSVVEPQQKVSTKMPKNDPDSKRSNHINNIIMSNIEPNNNNNSCRQPSSSPTAATTTNPSSRKRLDSNGEYQKPKQRRYRTERPFACPHCPARFTLRSNMERHGKHQHPTVWQRSPSNRVINRQKNQQNSPLIGSSPTMVPTSKYSSFDGKIQGLDKNTEAALQNVNVRQLISQQLKRKLSNSSIKGRGRGGGGDVDSSDENIIENSKLLLAAAGVTENTDLASVSQLLDRVKNSNFAQYFGSNEGVGDRMNEMQSGDDDQSCGDEDDDNMMDDDEEGRVAGESGGEDDQGQSTDDGEDGDSKVSGNGSGNEKKKSAYSSAPHKINCPHCSRKFPWTSSLRRHLLTHTGQKPYQCPDPECNLLFTTKSNCDRHLIRKHGDRSGRRARRVNGNDNDDGKNSSSGGTTEEDDENDEDEDQEQIEIDEVKDFVKKPKVSPINMDVTSTTTTPTLPTVNEQKIGKLATTPTNGEDATFRCHLCEASAQERDTLLNHMEEEHKDTFLMLMSKGTLTSSPPSENSENDNISPPSTTLGEKEQQTHRKIICVLCLRKFWSVEDLRRHMRSHSGERPFSCQLCSRKFTLKHSMLRHLKKHSASNTPVSSGAGKGLVSSKVLVGDLKGDKVSLSVDDESDLIGRLLGINDEKLVEQLLNNPDAKDAAKILGLAQAQQALKKHNITSTTK